MIILIWACLVIDVATALFFLGVILDPTRDAAGKGMIMLPAVLLLFIVAAGYMLLQKNHLGWAAFLTGLPVIILLYYLLISYT